MASSSPSPSKGATGASSSVYKPGSKGAAAPMATPNFVELVGGAVAAAVMYVF